MNALPLPGSGPDLILDAIERHGARRVLAVALLALLRAAVARPPRGPAALPDHLRRDVGLPAAPPPRPAWPHPPF